MRRHFHRVKGNDMNQSSRRYSVIFYGCLLVTVVLVGVMLFSEPTGPAEALGTTTQKSINQIHATTSTAVTTAAGTETPLSSSVLPDGSTTVNLRWSNTQIKDFLTQALERAEIAIDVQDITLLEPDTISMTGSIPRDTAINLLDISTIPSKEALRFALRLLPESLEIELSFKAEAVDHTLSVTPLKLVTQGISLPVSILPNSVTDSFHSLVASALKEQHCTLDSLFIADNVLYLTCTINK